MWFLTVQTIRQRASPIRLKNSEGEFIKKGELFTKSSPFFICKSTVFQNLPAHRTKVGTDNVRTGQDSAAAIRAEQMLAIGMMSEMT